MKCVVIESVGMVSVAYASWTGILEAEEKYCNFTRYPNIRAARICGLAIARMVEKPYMDWTMYKNRGGMRIGPNTWEAFL